MSDRDPPFLGGSFRLCSPHETDAIYIESDCKKNRFAVSGVKIIPLRIDPNQVYYVNKVGSAELIVIFSCFSSTLKIRGVARYDLFIQCLSIKGIFLCNLKTWFSIGRNLEHQSTRLSSFMKLKESYGIVIIKYKFLLTKEHDLELRSSFSVISTSFNKVVAST